MTTIQLASDDCGRVLGSANSRGRDCVRPTCPRRCRSAAARCLHRKRRARSKYSADAQMPMVIAVWPSCNAWRCGCPASTTQGAQPARSWRDSMPRAFRRFVAILPSPCGMTRPQISTCGVLESSVPVCPHHEIRTSNCPDASLPGSASAEIRAHSSGQSQNVKEILPCSNFLNLRPTPSRSPWRGRFDDLFHAKAGTNPVIDRRGAELLAPVGL